MVRWAGVGCATKIRAGHGKWLAGREREEGAGPRPAGSSRGRERKSQEKEKKTAMTNFNIQHFCYLANGFEYKLNLNFEQL
jgi:hypothetical protein